ncbi:MAG: low molecular weight phosphotyrosine protein phosphatase [Saprospiraceae bacterium]|nr:low molecular weight phosphotyrosine protein phosphatase [Saprospiraceae bacterium]
MKVLMVCLGNICRSPLAHGILESKIEKYDLSWTVDSAGTGGWHAGEAPDFRAIDEARRNGVDISKQKARQFSVSDFSAFDYILVMDAQNFQDVLQIAITAEQRNKVKMIMDFLHPGKNKPVPDPYYNGKFKEVYEMLDETIEKLVLQYAATAVS